MKVELNEDGTIKNDPTYMLLAGYTAVVIGLLAGAIVAEANAPEITAEALHNFKEVCANNWADFDPEMHIVGDKMSCLIMYEGKRVPTTNVTFTIGEK